MTWRHWQRSCWLRWHDVHVVVDYEGSVSEQFLTTLMSAKSLSAMTWCPRVQPPAMLKQLVNYFNFGNLMKKVKQIFNMNNVRKLHVGLIVNSLAFNYKLVWKYIYISKCNIFFPLHIAADEWVLPLRMLWREYNQSSEQTRGEEEGSQIQR